MPVQDPIIVDVDYRQSDNEIEGRIDSDSLHCINGAELTDYDRLLLKYFPTVYIIRAKQGGKRSTEYLLYVGETNSIVRRTNEHYYDVEIYRTQDNKEKWNYLNDPKSHARMLVIGQNHFNKSLTLDLENTFMSYVLASGVGEIELVNSRENPQGDYYTKDELDEITSRAWEMLHEYQPEIFPTEQSIRDSAIFKASPFHRLSDEQLAAESLILDVILSTLSTVNAESDSCSLIVVEGAAGTGKTVLLSHLFLTLQNRFSEMAAAEEKETGEKVRQYNANLLINHDEQLTVYNTIMKRLGLQSRDEELVMKPVKFINRHSEPGHGKGLDRQNYPTNPVDVALIDEAHLLATEGYQAYAGSKNMLEDIMKRAHVVVAVYDPDQVLRKSQELSPDDMTALFPSNRFSIGSQVGERRTFKPDYPRWNVRNIRLRHQLRIDASEEVIAWIDSFSSGKGLGPIPRDTPRKGHIPYEIKVFDSPSELYQAIEDHAITFDDQGHLADDCSMGISRVLATYDWGYSRKRKPVDGRWEVRICREETGWVALDNEKSVTEYGPDLGEKDYFHLPWNYEGDKEAGERTRDMSWAEQPHTLGECGSIYTIQGFDLNYAGVILGPSVKWRNGEIVFDENASHNYQAIDGSNNPKANIQHELNVLLKRGVHGLYLFAVDSELQQHLKQMSAGLSGSIQA